MRRRNSKKNKDYTKIIIVVMVFIMFTLSIGFGYFKDDLVVSGTGKISGNWGIEFQDLSTPTISNGGLVGSAIIESPASITDKTTLTFDVSLVKPGDKIVYHFNVKNTGVIDAKITDFELIGASEAASKGVIYSLSYYSGTALNINDTLNAGVGKQLELIVEYDSNATTVNTDLTNITLGATIEYYQA